MRIGCVKDTRQIRLDEIPYDKENHFLANYVNYIRINSELFYFLYRVVEIVFALFEGWISKEQHIYRFIIDKRNRYCKYLH